MKGFARNMLMSLTCLLLSGCSSTSVSLHPFSIKYDNKHCHFDYKNDFIHWKYDSDKGGLNGAYVLNDSKDNLLLEPVGFQMVLENDNGSLDVYEYAGLASIPTFEENSIILSYCLKNRKTNKVLDGVTITNAIRDGGFGDLEQRIRLETKTPITNLRRLSPVVLKTTDQFDTYGAKEMRACGNDKWGLNGVADWLSLKTDKEEIYRCSRVPLYMLLFERGGAGIEYCMMSDISQWEVLGEKQSGVLIHNKEKHSYEFTVSAYDSEQKGTLDGIYEFDYRLTLPFVRKKMCPIRPAESMCYYERGSANRWPTEADFQSMQDAGYTLLKIHNDCDNCHDGIFWRDAVYPPYPPAVMKQMDESLATAAKHGMKVVPYISMKEMHPDAPWFKDHSQEWAKLNEPNDPIWITSWGDLVFGGVMCLKSGWLEKRKATIKQILDNHAFKGVYFDWCTALECNNTRHFAKHHWDIDEHIELLKWTKALCGADGEIYLHMTHVPLLVAENMATLLLTEESVQPVISQTMFTPHVHFMNTASRSVCNMLENRSPENNRKIAMAALLNHATVAIKDDATIGLYKENRAWMEAVTQYDRFHAPGEGYTTSDNPNVGVSFYESRDGSSMAILANLTNETVTVKYDCNGKFAKQSGTVTMKPLEMKAITKK